MVNDIKLDKQKISDEFNTKNHYKIQKFIDEWVKHCKHISVSSYPADTKLFMYLSGVISNSINNLPYHMKKNINQIEYVYILVSACSAWWDKAINELDPTVDKVAHGLTEQRYAELWFTMMPTLKAYHSGFTSVIKAEHDLLVRGEDHEISY